MKPLRPPITKPRSHHAPLVAAPQIPGWGLPLNWTGTPLRDGVKINERAPGRYTWST